MTVHRGRRREGMICLGLRDPAEFLQDLLTVGDASGDLVHGLAGEQQCCLRHHDRRFRIRIIQAGDQLVVHRSGRRNDLRR